MGDIDLMLKELKRYGNAGRDCALSAEDALTIASALEAARAEREVIVAEALKYADKSGRLEAKVDRLAAMLSLAYAIEAESA